jgi:hypothetical protein
MEATVKKCDVTGKTKDVKPVTIGITALNGEAAPTEVLSRTVDLCPKALERLTKAVNRATSPAKKRT